MIVDKIPRGFLISQRTDAGELFKRKYYGYSETEAMRLFAIAYKTKAEATA